jgi:cytochrome c biogenesis protein ResB
VFRLLASLKVTIPLLVLLTAVTIVGSLFPEPDMFKSAWYLGLLGLLGLSLLFITILHIPAILKRKGRNTLIGVITTHLGILVLIVGVIYGGFSGFRHEIKLIEGEITVIPGLPFVIQLDELLVEEYRQEEFPRKDLDTLPKKRQDSRITLLKGGKPWLSTVVAPGNPAIVDGITLLPSISDTGWYFELVAIDARGTETTIPVRPWAPPLIVIAGKRLMTHSVVTGESPQAEFFAIEEDQQISLGIASREQALVIEGNSLSLGPVKRYTGMQVYNRPQEPVLVAGSILMFAGLVWHFYFRHRDRRREQGRDAGNA